MAFKGWTFQHECLLGISFKSSDKTLLLFLEINRPVPVFMNWTPLSINDWK